MEHSRSGCRNIVRVPLETGGTLHRVTRRNLTGPEWTKGEVCEQIVAELSSLRWAKGMVNKDVRGGFECLCCTQRATQGPGMFPRTVASSVRD